MQTSARVRHVNAREGHYFQIKRNERLLSSTTEHRSDSNTAEVYRAAAVLHNFSSSHMMQARKCLTQTNAVKMGPSLYNAVLLNNKNLIVHKRA